MKNLKPIAVAFPLFFASPAYAAPVYLTCPMQPNGKPSPIDVTVDEATGTAAVFVRENGRTHQMRAAFTQEEVTFQTDMISYKLSRVSLTLTRSVPLINRYETVVCSLSAPVKRAF